MKKLENVTEEKEIAYCDKCGIKTKQEAIDGKDFCYPHKAIYEEAFKLVFRPLTKWSKEQAIEMALKLMDTLEKEENKIWQKLNKKNGS